MFLPLIPATVGWVEYLAFKELLFHEDRIQWKDILIRHSVQEIVTGTDCWNAFKNFIEDFFLFFVIDAAVFFVHVVEIL